MPQAFRPSRRRFLGGLGLSAAAMAWSAARAPAEDAATADGLRLLRARSGSARSVFPNRLLDPIWGYEGITPGPLLRVRRGDELKVRLVNELVEPTSVHWHGLRLPNGMDGVPHLTQEPIAPGASFDYRFRPPDAGTFWYHSQQNASEQLIHGLFGMLIVDEAEPVDVEHDVALAVDDWRLASAGRIDQVGTLLRAPAHGNEATESKLLVPPVYDIAVKSNERVRLRLLNASSTWAMALRIEGHAASVMALDGQPAEPFVARDSRVALAPGNRVDLFIDAALPPRSIALIAADAGWGELAVARLLYDAGPPARPAPRAEPKPLPANPLPQKMDFAGARKLDVPLGGNAAAAGTESRGVDADNGRAARPLFSVQRGRTVMLAFANRGALAYAVHVHGHHFRLLDRLDDGWKPFWLDTVLVPPRLTVRIAFVADNPGKWRLHRQTLEHQESGVAAWFEVT